MDAHLTQMQRQTANRFVDFVKADNLPDEFEDLATFARRYRWFWVERDIIPLDITSWVDVNVDLLTGGQH